MLTCYRYYRLRNVYVVYNIYDNVQEAWLAWISGFRVTSRSTESELSRSDKDVFHRARESRRNGFETLE